MAGTPDLAPASVLTSSGARRLAGRVLAIVLSLALPTGFLTWIFGFDLMKKRINGWVWCRDADEVIFDVNLTRSGSSTRISDSLLCRTDGTTVRTISDMHMTATNIAVAFAVSLALLGLVVVFLVALSRLRRRKV